MKPSKSLLLLLAAIVFIMTVSPLFPVPTIATAEFTPNPIIVQVQTLINTLPDADTITAENRAKVEAQLTAIDDARLMLNDDSTLDYTRYESIVSALNKLDNASDVATDPETFLSRQMGNYTEFDNDKEEK